MCGRWILFYVLYILYNIYIKVNGKIMNNYGKIDDEYVVNVYVR